MSDGMEYEESEGYDPYTDPDSEHYDADYDPDADPWNDTDYDPFEDDYNPDTGERNDNEGESALGTDKFCLPYYCEVVEVEKDECYLVCYERCTDGSGITTVTDWDCEVGSPV